MRIERSITTVSWIPSDLLEGMGRMATKMKMAHDDPPPPDELGSDIPATIDALRTADRFRFANHLSAFVEVDGQGRIVSHGHLGKGSIGATTIGLGITSITVPAISLPDQASVVEVTDTYVKFAQTVGGRTGAPLPRTLKHPPFVQYRAPIVWTTLELTIHADGTHEAAMVGASKFPRHWVYDDGGKLTAKSSVAEYKEWMASSFGKHTPWGDEDSPAIVSEVESQLERQIQGSIMRGQHKPEIRQVKLGACLSEQGSPANELFLLLNGLLSVEVDGAPIAELGPGSVLGERALFEGGVRTATLRAVTACKVAVVPHEAVDHAALAELAERHRREDARS